MLKKTKFNKKKAEQDKENNLNNNTTTPLARSLGTLFDIFLDWNLAYHSQFYTLIYKYLSYSLEILEMGGKISNIFITRQLDQMSLDNISKEISDYFNAFVFHRPVLGCTSLVTLSKLFSSQQKIFEKKL